MYYAFCMVGWRLKWISIDVFRKAFTSLTVKVDMGEFECEILNLLLIMQTLCRENKFNLFRSDGFFFSGMWLNRKVWRNAQNCGAARVWNWDPIWNMKTFSSNLLHLLRGWQPFEAICVPLANDAYVTEWPPKIHFRTELMFVRYRFDGSEWRKLDAVFACAWSIWSLKKVVCQLPRATFQRALVFRL